MAVDGWVKIHRKIQENPLWTCEKFTRGQAWVDLLLLANHSSSFFYKRGVKIDVSRGQLARSEVELSSRWKWSRTKVKKFLKDLEKEQQIAQQKTNVTQIVTILNYDEYQKKEQQVLQQKCSRSAAEVQQKNTYKNVKNEENVKKETNTTKYSEKFLLFWEEYPNKQGKAKAFASWKKHGCDNGKFEKIMSSLEKFKSSQDWTKENGKYVPHGATWVYNQRWEDDIDSTDEWGRKC